MDDFENKVLQIVRDYMKNSAFTDRKLTDNPTDALQVVNRKFVTQNGLTAARPANPVVGQQYFDLTLASGRGKPIYWNGTNWVDATGTIV